MQNKRVAIIGGGISGVGLLHVLKQHSDHEVVLFEQADRLGGHAHAYRVHDELVDTGFMVCNELTYPNLMRFFKDLDIKLYPTTMAFACDDRKGKWSFSFSQASRSLWYAVRHIGFIIQVLATQWKIKRDVVRRRVLPHETIAEYCSRRHVSQRVRQYFLVPVIASVWSQMNGKKVGDMPAEQIFNFMNNHRLLEITQPQWYSLVGSSQTYLDAIYQMYTNNIYLNSPVKRVNSLQDLQTITYEHQGETIQKEFDVVVFACHTNQIMSVCDDLSVQQQKVLTSVKYQENAAVLHTDSSWMPHLREEWGAWNFVRREASDKYVCTYHLNCLQQLKTSQDIFITLDPTESVDPNTVIATFEYAHPVFTTESARAMSKLQDIQGKGGYYFAGAWARNGFHEDGLWSALLVFQHMEGWIPEGYRV